MITGPDSFRFGDFEVDRRSGELRNAGVPVRIQEQPLQLLIALLEQPGRIVTRESLRARLWPSDTFVEFDQSLHTAVRKLRQALGDSADAPHWIETLARRGYRFIGLVEESGHGMPDPPAPAPLPEGDDPQPAISTSIRRRTLAIAASAIAIIAVVTAILTAHYWPQNQPLQLRSLAVLPFANLTGQPKQQYLADALTDKLITDLAGIRTLRVISRTSSMRYQQSEKRLPEIARELGVDAVVEGSLVMAGQRLRVNARLVDSRNDRSLWARDYDASLSDLSRLQSELTAAIGAQLRVRVTGLSMPRGACTSEGYLLYLNGRYTLNRGRFSDIPAAAGYFQKAIAASPECAAAYSGLAEAALFGRNDRPPAESMAEAKRYAETALRLDRSMAEPHSSLAMVRMFLLHDWDGAAKEFTIALTLAPGSAETHQRYAMLLAARGQFDSALAQARQAVDLDPLAALLYLDLGRIEYFARRYDDARRDLDRAKALEPGLPLAESIAITTLIVQHRDAEATQRILKGMEHAPSFRDRFESVARRQGLAAALEEGAHAQAAMQSGASYVRSSELAFEFSEAGDVENALYWLELAYRSRTRDIVYVAVEPAYDSIRQTARYRAIVQAMGL